MNVFSKIIKHKVPVMQGNLSSKTRFTYTSRLRLKTRFANDFGVSMDDITRYNSVDNIQWYCGSDIAMRYATYFKRVQRGTTR